MIPISGQQAVFCWGALPGSIYQRSHYSTVHSRELFTCRGLEDHGFDRCAGRGLLMTLGRRRDIISDKRSRANINLADQTRCGDYKLIITIDVGGPFHFLAHTWGQSPIPNKTQSKNSTRELTVFYWIHHLDHPPTIQYLQTLLTLGYNNPQVQWNRRWWRW